MPSASKYTGPNETSREIVYNQERRARAEHYMRVKQYYIGEQRKYLDVKPGEPDDNITLNTTRVAIDRTLSLLFPSMPKLEIDPLNPDLTDEELWLSRFWAQNKGIFKLTEIAQNGAFSGQYYVRVKEPMAGGSVPRIINLNPVSMTSYWNGEDIEDVLWHEQFWSSQNKEFLLDYVKDQTTGFWRIYYYTREFGGAWTLQSEEAWNSVYGPIVTGPHMPLANSFYGLSEGQNLHLDDKLNLITSEAARITRYHGSPKTVGLGIEASDIQETSIDGLWTTATPKTEADIYNLEMKAPASEFVQSLLTRIRDAKLEENRVVVLRGDIKDFQRVTNAGIRTVFMDMLAKNALLRESYGQAIQRISMAAAYVAGVTLPTVPDVVWPDPLPSDDAELVATAQKELEMGIASKTQIAAKRGYNFKEVAALQEQESKHAVNLTSAPAV